MRIALIKTTLFVIGFGVCLLFLSACTVVPLHGTVETRIGQYTPYGTAYNYNYKDVRIQIREDEFGLVGFRVSEGGLHSAQVKWVTARVDSLKSHCKNGGVMKKYEIVSLEHASPYLATMSNHGNSSVHIDYVCNRGLDDKVPPRLAPR